MFSGSNSMHTGTVGCTLLSSPRLPYLLLPPRVCKLLVCSPCSPKTEAEQGLRDLSLAEKTGLGSSSAPRSDLAATSWASTRTQAQGNTCGDPRWHLLTVLLPAQVNVAWQPRLGPFSYRPHASLWGWAFFARLPRRHPPLKSGVTMAPDWGAFAPGSGLGPPLTCLSS